LLVNCLPCNGGDGGARRIRTPGAGHYIGMPPFTSPPHHGQLYEVLPSARTRAPDPHSSLSTVTCPAHRTHFIDCVVPCTHGRCRNKECYPEPKTTNTVLAVSCVRGASTVETPGAVIPRVRPDLISDPISATTRGCQRAPRRPRGSVLGGSSRALRAPGRCYSIPAVAPSFKFASFLLPTIALPFGVISRRHHTIVFSAGPGNQPSASSVLCSCLSTAMESCRNALAGQHYRFVSRVTQGDGVPAGVQAVPFLDDKMRR